MKAKLAQSAARKSHNLKVVSSNLTLRIFLKLFFKYIINCQKYYVKKHSNKL